MKKSITKIILASLFAFGMSSMASAQITSADQGEYVMINADKTESTHIHFTPVKKYWIAKVQKTDNSWAKVACGNNNKECRFTPTSYKTLKRFLTNQPDLLKIINGQLKGLAISCVDVTELAFCRLDESQKKTYFLINDQGGLTLLQKR
ncbi:hypothetical protein BMT54_05055 [Pasteurellaceae bacterium 15-036681]|nr:hypothetical protein BMT54_05055 [Pasteurellaceae bacterium 15-036681]